MTNQLTEAQRALGDLIYEIAESAEEGNGMYLSIEDVAILGPELRRLRGIAYRARLVATNSSTSAPVVEALDYIAGEPT